MEQVNEPIASSANDPWVSPYPNLTKDEFLTMILMGASKTRYQLGFFILNTLHFIQIDRSYYYCQDNQKCKICLIPIIFSGFEGDVETTMLPSFGLYVFDKLFFFWIVFSFLFIISYLNF